MEKKIQSINQIISGLLQLTEADKASSRSVSGLIDELFNYLDGNHLVSKLSETKINQLKTLETSIVIQKVNQSDLIEELILSLGTLFAQSLESATEYGEAQLISEQIGEYVLFVSKYAEETGRFDESLGVDLGEAALFKIQELKNKKYKGESTVYISQFKKALDHMRHNATLAK